MCSIIQGEMKGGGICTCNSLHQLDPLLYDQAENVLQAENVKTQMITFFKVAGAN